MLRSIDGDWEVDLKTNQMTLNLKGLRKGESVSKSGLTTADKEWIANLVISTVKPINDRLEVIEKDVSDIKDHLKAIEECPTIKKELKKDGE